MQQTYSFASNLLKTNFQPFELLLAQEGEKKTEEKPPEAIEGEKKTEEKPSEAIEGEGEKEGETQESEGEAPYVPTIDQGAENVIYIGIFLITIGILAVIGILLKRPSR